MIVQGEVDQTQMLLSRGVNKEEPLHLPVVRQLQISRIRSLRGRRVICSFEWMSEQMDWGEGGSGNGCSLPRNVSLL